MKLILLIALTLGVFGQPNQKPESQKECPMHATHTQMNERGEKGMGFSQTATTHPPLPIELKWGSDSG